MFEISKNVKTKTISLRLKEDEYKFMITQAKKHKLSLTDYFKYVMNKEYLSLSEEDTEANTGDKTHTIIDTNTKTNTKTKKTTDNNTKSNKSTISSRDEKRIIMKKSVVSNYKICKICGIEKPITDYHISKTDKVSGKVYYKSYCSTCAKNR